MKIAIFVPNIKSVCGRSKICLSLIAGLNEIGNDVILITNAESDIKLISLSKEKIFIIPCNPNGKSIISFLKCLLWLKKISSSQKLNIISVHHRYPEFISLIARIIFRINTRIIMTVHSFTNDHKSLSYNSDKVIAVSNFIKTHLMKFYQIKENKLEVIYNGVEKSGFDSCTSILESNYLLAYGRFEFEKGFDLLIKAFSKIKLKTELPKLLLIGEGSEFPILRLLTIAEKIQVEFYKFESVPWNIIEKALFVTVPSREESLGLVVLEAGLMGKAVIAADVGGIPEIIDHEKTGLLFEGENVSELSKSILILMQNNKYEEQLGANLRERVMKDFSLVKMIANYEKVFNSLLSEQPR